MSTITTAEELTQAAIDVGILDERQLQQVRSEQGAGTASLEEYQQLLLRSGLVTNFQLERLMSGMRGGYFYGNYKVLYGVGAGTFARVYRAVDTKTGNVYALKVLRNRKAAEPESVEAFRREGELGLPLKHPNIVPIHEVVSKRMLHYIVMDFIEGRNLRDFFRVRGRFTPVESTHFMEGIMAGLTYASAQGITHRDLKMSNVLVSSDGVAKLVDFGLAALESDAPGEATNKRTIEYTALERATGVKKDDTRSDIYFAGCMFYQMIAGKNPLPEGRDRMNKFNRSTFTDIVPIMKVAPDTPPNVAKVINKAMEIDPERRYQTAAEMLAELKILEKRLAAGSTEAATAQTSLASEEGLDDKGEPRRLMIVESNVKMQDLLRNLFKKHGYRVLVTSDPQRARDRFVADPATAEVVLFTSAHSGRAALEVFNQLAADKITQQIPAVLLLDERHRDWHTEATVGPHRATVNMPIKQRELRKTIRDVLSCQTV